LTSWDIGNPTSLLTGVAKIEINDANPITKPTQAQTLIEVVPYMSSVGAQTPGQAYLTKCIIESNSINLLPKNFLVPPILSGLGTFTATQTPMLDTIECNTALELGSTQQFRVYGQNFIANTVANKLGIALHYSEAQTSAKEMFYELPTNEANTGTSATSVAGSNMTINDGRFLETITPVVVNGVVTASESYLASIEISSNDFDNSMPLKVPCQPISTALGSHVSVSMPKLPRYQNIHMGMKSSCTISQTLTLSEALTATGNWICGVGYTKM